MTPEQRYAALVEAISAEFPRFRIVVKSHSRLHRAIHYGLMVLTAGGMRQYLDGYQTTIGQGLYVTDDWDERDANVRYITLRHELVHLRQFRRYPVVGMALAYLFLPLPAGLSWARARLEWEAYRETVVATAEVHGEAAVDNLEFRQRIIDQFTGPSYGWMWPFPRQVGHWIDTAVGEVLAELRNRGRH